MHATRQTIGEMLAKGEGVRVGCSRCKSGRLVDLAKLIEAKGPDYSLFNRRCRCKLMKGCPGYNRFFTTSGFGKMFWDEATDLRWMEDDRQQRHAELEAMRLKADGRLDK